MLTVKMEVIDAGFKGEVYCDEDQRSWKVLRHCAIWKSASVKTMESVNCREHGVTQAALQKSLMLFLSSEVVSVVSDMTFQNYAAPPRCKTRTSAHFTHAKEAWPP